MLKNLFDKELQKLANCTINVLYHFGRCTMVLEIMLETNEIGSEEYKELKQLVSNTFIKTNKNI